jgi:polyhydroxyalkanoate synthesis regulator phasin
MKKDEQKKYLDDLLNTANEIESKSLEKAIEYETEKIAEYEAIRKKFTDE